MESSISIREKREFIHYLLVSHRFNRREIAWVLNYLLVTEDLLERCRFVKDVEKCPIGLLISTSDSRRTDLCLYKNGTRILDGDHAFYVIRYLEGPLYIEVAFPNHQGNIALLHVLEENPFSSPPTKEAEKLATLFIEHCLNLQKVVHLEKEIDAALDRKDEESFLVLSTELNEVKQKMNP